MPTSASEALQRHFGFREFLDGQEPVITALLEGRDAMVVMPTGGGKSLCYQLPALCLEGVTLVISPLIALMKDQVDALAKKGIPAAMINSTLTLDEQRQRLKELRSGKLKLVYVAPERFRSEAFRSALRQVEIGLFAVDEAHCLSQWGHDFRPDYLRLEQTLEELGHPQTAAFTATATPQVRGDILNTLKLRDPFVSVTGFERPNLSLRVREVKGNKEKYEKLNAVAKEWKTGIVYCSTRKHVEDVAASLVAMGKSAVAYHGGMSDDDREAAQDNFLNRTSDIVVATNAFGMGIDRSDVRFVVHFDVPGSIEAYYQEAGRAGRDREPAVCELLFNFADTTTQDFFIEGNNPDPELIRSIYGALHNQADDQHQCLVSGKEIADMAGAKNGMAVSSAISVLTRSGYIQRYDVHGERRRGSRLLQPKLTADDIELDERALAEKRRNDGEKLKGMIRYTREPICRQEWILRYFGEGDPSQCGSCDVCQDEDRGELRGPYEGEALVVKKALSGVARMSRRTTTGYAGRFGKGKIVNMLVGSAAADIIDKGLDRLTTYGLLKTEGTAYVYALFQELEREQLLVTGGHEYPLVSLTDRGVAVMKGATDYRLNWPDRSRLSKPKSKSRKRETSASQDLAEMAGLEFDASLYEKLRQKRAELAAAEGGKPAYIIFSDQTLEFFTRLKPKSMEAGLKIRGVGAVKAKRYLEDFLEVIRGYGGV
ncbi:MAG: ATP-dependent DNA helicase RecQ [Verrucomicrobiales bacterium]|jgi:ATP-dependent DNA helicase RecQ